MSEEPMISRRGLISVGLGTAAGLIAERLTAAAPAGPDCAAATPEQTSGPFYPTHDREDEDPDLTHVKGRSARASGEVIYVQGRVLDETCRPVGGALVEIWQANRYGRYDHEKDAGNPRPLDPNFQGWAEMLTDAEGRYRFKTIKPGSYPVEGDWIRPPHIHFKVSRRGYHELITQLYFAGEPLNEADQIRRALAPEERDRVTVEFQSSPPELEAGTQLGTFDITLRKVG
ncbi:MAG: intradiol ring-cleavage dioxygenase [Gemmatimonadota bacterium]